MSDQQLQLYKVVGVHPAYETYPGGTVELDPDADGVALNVAAGVIELAGDEPKAERIACPACSETRKRPPKFDSQEELAAHYAKEHPALTIPTEE